MKLGGVLVDSSRMAARIDIALMEVIRLGISQSMPYRILHQCLEFEAGNEDLREAGSLRHSVID